MAHSASKSSCPNPSSQPRTPPIRFEPAPPWTPAPLSAYRVIAFDMDSTLVAIETLDEMAALMGRGAEVAAITEAAMRGRSATTSKACARAVALLAGMPQALADQV